VPTEAARHYTMLLEERDHVREERGPAWSTAEEFYRGTLDLFWDRMSPDEQRAAAFTREPEQRVGDFVARLRSEFPAASIRVSAPLDVKAGSWTVDLVERCKWLVIQYRAASGFGLSTTPEESVYGEGPDEIIQDEGALMKRVREAIATGTASQ
jgi:hypothetical protein